MTPTSRAEEAPLRGKLIMTGSSTIAPLALEIGKRFEARHPEVRVDVQTGGSSRGVADVGSGIAAVGLVSRAAKPQELKALRFTTIALDGIALIVHKTNPVRELTADQIRAIYTRKTVNWRDVGGPDAPITVVNKAEGRSTLELFISHFKLKNSDIKAHVVIGDNEQGVKTVAGNEHAIGYVSVGTAEFSAQLGTKIKLLPLGGVAASVANVSKGTYPLSRPLNLVTKSDATGLAKAYIDFAQSETVDDLVKEQFFVPLAR